MICHVDIHVKRLVDHDATRHDKRIHSIGVRQEAILQIGHAIAHQHLDIQFLAAEIQHFLVIVLTAIDGISQLDSILTFLQRVQHIKVQILS